MTTTLRTHRSAGGPSRRCGAAALAVAATGVAGGPEPVAPGRQIRPPGIHRHHPRRVPGALSRFSRRGRLRPLSSRPAGVRCESCCRGVAEVAGQVRNEALTADCCGRGGAAPFRRRFAVPQRFRTLVSRLPARSKAGAPCLLRRVLRPLTGVRGKAQAGPERGACRELRRAGWCGAFQSGCLRLAVSQRSRAPALCRRGDRKPESCVLGPGCSGGRRARTGRARACVSGQAAGRHSEVAPVPCAPTRPPWETTGTPATCVPLCVLQ